MGKEPVGLLCVDDNALLAGALERRIAGEPGLKWLGWIADPAAAETAIAALGPDVVLMDVHMPGYDTLALVRRVTDAWPGVRVLMLSGRFDAATIRAAVAAGAQGYVVKDEPPADIVRAIRQAAAGARVFSKTARWMAELG